MTGWARRTSTLILVAIPGAAAAAVSPARHLGGGGAIEVSLGRIILSLLICIAIAVLAILLLRQRRGKIDLRAAFARFEPRARVIEIVETRRLSPHADISLVRSGGHEYLLLLQQGNITVLRDKTADESAPCG